MADIADFTGYTWVGNDRIYPMFYSVDYSIKFKSNNTNFTQFRFINVFDDIIEDKLLYDDVEIYSDIDDIWKDAAYKTVVFTSDLTGTEIDRNQLSTWLAENGTLIAPGVNKFKLGTIDIAGLQLGAETINKVYLGTEVVYQKN